ncbi:MAG: THUMP domain-containing protein [Candidatus Hodarchaeota archaeon]
MNNFNLLVSTSRYNEDNARAEMWFILLMCGDHYSIFSSLDFQGLIAVATTLNHRKVVSKIKKLMNQNANFFQYILKIVPIDYVCQTNARTIKAIIQKHQKEYINNQESFMIKLNRRKNEIIDRDNLIESIARIIDNKVNLENPDKIVRIEVLGKFTGISFLKPNDIIKTRNKMTNPN